jgi:hypothetical protein
MRHESPLPSSGQEGSAVSETTDQPTGGSTPGWINVQNETPTKLVVPGEGKHVLVLAPLEQRRLREDACASYRRGLERLEELRCVSIWQGQPEGSSRALAFVGIGFWLVVFWLIGGIFLSSPLYWIGGTVFFAVFGLIGYFWTNKEPTILSLIVSLLLVLAIGVIAPAATVYFGGDVHEAVDLVLAEDDELAFLTLIGRGLQWAFIAVASVLPALLFFVFDRVKLVTLRQTFEREMLRFDPTVATLADVRARYGPRMEEVYGRVQHLRDKKEDPGEEEWKVRRNGSRRVLPDRRGPVVMATLVITIGWVLALLNPDVKAPLANASQIVLLFEPQRSPVVFAFLGAYVFALNAVLRSYVRSDLRPKSYTHIVVRIIVAVVFAWVLEALFFSTPQATTGEDVLLVLAFAVGMLPETLLVRVQELMRTFVGKRAKLPSLVERYPLTDLEGIDIYDRARLVDEGVGNIEGLAHHDIPALMMYTRIPPGRLVHWTDQAILFLHVAATGENDGGAEARLQKLKAYGIHTATDLQGAHDKAESRGQPDYEAFLALLDETPATGVELTATNGQPSRIQVILDSVQDEQWMVNLLHWHMSEHDVPKTLLLTAEETLVEDSDPARAPEPTVAAADGAGAKATERKSGGVDGKSAARALTASPTKQPPPRR